MTANSRELRGKITALVSALEPHVTVKIIYDKYIYINLYITLLSYDNLY